MEGWLKSSKRIFNCKRVGAPNPHVVQRSVVLDYYCLLQISLKAHRSEHVLFRSLLQEGPQPLTFFIPLRQPLIALQELEP